MGLLPAAVRALPTPRRAVARACAAGAGSRSPRVVVGIESSFDDSSVAVVSEDGGILAQETISQRSAHLSTGGTVPSLAAKLHHTNLGTACERALGPDRSRFQVDAVAVTAGPGLGPCLKEGCEFATRLARELHVPLIPVHHMEAHALTVRMLIPVAFPYLVLLVSGGHCILAVVRGVGDIVRLGSTRDDSPGEAFDKVARELGIVGGSELEQLASQGCSARLGLPVPMRRERSCDFSFAGLKTATKALIAREAAAASDEPGAAHHQRAWAADVAASFQDTVALHLAVRSARAILYCEQYLASPPITGVVVAGGVACNGAIRSRLQAVVQAAGLDCHSPPPELCTDNGAMIAWLGMEHLRLASSMPGHVIPPDSLPAPGGLYYLPRWPLGTDASLDVTAARISVRKSPLWRAAKGT